MDYHIRDCFSHSLMLQGIILTYHSFHLEWAREVHCQLWQYHSHKVIEVILPPTIVGEAVTITLFSYKV